MRPTIQGNAGSATAPGGRTPALARELLQSVADSPAQSAALLAGLAGLALTSPVMAGLAALAGAGFLAWRPRPAVGVLGADTVPGLKPRLYADWELFHVGRHVATGEALRMTNDGMRQHFLVTGLPGRRAPVLLGLAESVVAKGSGLLYVAGRGDDAAYRGMCEVAARHGRSDDVRVLDLRPSGRARTHTFNPFARGSADQLSQVVVGLAVEGLGGDGPSWAAKLTALLTGLCRILVREREAGRPLRASTFLENLSLETLVAMSEGRGRWGDTDADARAAVRSYLNSLSCYEAARGARQSQATREVHAVLQEAVVRVLQPMATDYAHVFETDEPTVDLHDVTRQRRLLMVLLPGLGQGERSLSFLGQVVLATVKGAMGGALGGKVHGGWEDLVDNRAAHMPAPFMCVLDDIGDYMVRGLSVMAAQARSLSFSMVYGADDVASLAMANGAEGASVVSNTGTRIDLGPGWDAGSGAGPPHGVLRHRGREIPYVAHLPRASRGGAPHGCGDLMAVRDATRAECKAGEFGDA